MVEKRWPNCKRPGCGHIAQEHNDNGQCEYRQNLDSPMCLCNQYLETQPTKEPAIKGDNLTHLRKCQKAQLLAIELKLLWKEIRDYCVEQEALVDPENDGIGPPKDGFINTNILNDEIYSPMYPAFREYKKISHMLAETGTLEWLEDCTEPDIIDKDFGK